MDRSDQDLQLKQKVLEELNNKYNEFEEQKKLMEKEINEITLQREKVWIILIVVIIFYFLIKKILYFLIWIT